MRRFSTETVVGIFVVVGLICVGYMTIKLGRVSFFGRDTYPLYARFASVAGLRPGSPVEVFGIEVGSVTSLDIDEQREMAVVGMRIDKGVKVYEDSAATIKTAGLIGDKYVKIDPGGAGPVLAPRGMITQTSVPPDIEDLIGRYAFGDVKKGAENPGK
jgi:phospholipid/cholesterol/gamma-HCH transport system substrate-binding protein